MAPALVVADVKLPSPLFALVPGLVSLYAAAPAALVFVLALLQAQWTYTGYDASAHVAEETVLARLNSAWGVFLSVAVSAVVGYVLLMILTWCIPKGDVVLWTMLLVAALLGLSTGASSRATGSWGRVATAKADRARVGSWYGGLPCRGRC